jgi:hypothetical protein
VSRVFSNTIRLPSGMNSGLTSLGPPKLVSGRLLRPSASMIASRFCRPPRRMRASLKTICRPSGEYSGSVLYSRS